MELMEPWVVAFSGAVGLLIGLFGGGGSILAVPMFVLVSGIPASSAITMSLALVGATSAVAALAHHRRGLVRKDVVVWFGAAGMVGAFAGAHLTYAVSESTLLTSFAVLLIVVGAWMALRSGAAPDAQVASAGAARPISVHASLLAGAVVGGATGFLGVGGGFLVVPALVGVARLELREAIGTSLAVVALNSCAGLLAHVHAAEVDLALVAAATLAGVGGGLLGERLGRKLQLGNLRRGLAAFLVITGVVTWTTVSIRG